MLTTDTWIKICCALMINAVSFGAGLILVLTVPALSERAMYLIPAVVVASFVSTPFLSPLVARRMRIRNWDRASWIRGDAISR